MEIFYSTYTYDVRKIENILPYHREISKKQYYYYVEFKSRNVIFIFCEWKWSTSSTYL